MRPSTLSFVCLTALIALSAAAFAQQSPPAPAGLYDASPYLGQIRNDVLFGDVWERPGLSKRDRSLVTIAVNQALYATEELRLHIARGLDNGLTPSQIAEAIAHVLVYSGFPTGVNASRVAAEVFKERGLPARPQATPRNREPIGPPAYPGTFQTTPYLSELLNEFVYGELWERPDLSKRDRSVITVAVAQTMGATSELRAHLGRALDNGVTQAEINEIITHVSFYAGFPSGMNASQVAASVFQARKMPVPQADFPGAPSLDALVDRLLAPTWERGGLSARDRSLVTVAVVQTLYATEELRAQMNRAIENGVTPEQLSELIAHLTLYAGFPRGVNGSRTAAEVLKERGLPLPRP